MLGFLLLFHCFLWYNKSSEKGAENIWLVIQKIQKMCIRDRIIGVIMLIVAIVFIMFALNHPEKSFPWNNTITWLLYGVYFLVAVVLLIAPRIKK